jgi:hypothetical protein
MVAFGDDQRDWLTARRAEIHGECRDELNVESVGVSGSPHKAHMKSVFGSVMIEARCELMRCDATAKNFRAQETLCYKWQWL